tara:strand:- start:577 stop:750 length:174 start_codon:yes stop_codon:yes gene_type:complete
MEPVAVTRVERGETSSTLTPKTSAFRTTDPPTAIGDVSNAIKSTVTEASVPAVFSMI